MSFEYDIFISYGWVDDEDPAGEMKGWVDLLVERLPRVVASYLGDKPRLWRDERSLRGNDLLASAINDGVARSRLFVPVVSPRYVLSEWCRKELDAFCATGSTAGAGAHRSRIFKVVKTPLLLPHLKEPEALRELIGYSFYEMEGDRPREFSPDVAPAKDQRYWDTLGRLAWDITNTLAEMHGAAEDGGEARPQFVPAKRFVYLAEPTLDLVPEHNNVRNELRQRGYEVLPEQRLPLEERRKTEEAVRQDLARCALSVHMVGAHYGETPEDDPASVVHIQEQLAAERGAAEPAFKRVLWMPRGLGASPFIITDARQRAFIDELRSGRFTANSELLQTSLEMLKARLSELLRTPEKAIPVALPVSQATAPAATQAKAAVSPAQRSHDLFISFASANEPLAKNVRAALEDVGVRCWMSCDDILPGEDYGQAIIEALNSSRLVILVFTSESNKSRHVANEIDRAFNKDKPVILFRTENIPLSKKLEYYVSTPSWLNAWEPPMEKHIPVLVEKVKRLLAKLPPAE